MKLFPVEARWWISGRACVAHYAMVAQPVDKYLNSCVDAKTTELIFSDGCDTASPAELAERVKPILRRAGKLVWVNPLLGRFEPGEVDKYMDPVVPYVDRYCSAHNLNSIIELERELLA